MLQSGTESMARPPSPSATATAGGKRRPVDAGGGTMVTPFARAMELLWAFTPQDRWLGNRELAQRTGLPPSTVSRIAQTLVLLGYLHHAHVERKYRLAPSVLALGYGVIANSG